MAVQWMDPMSHTELLDVLPQLVQVGVHPVLKGWTPDSSSRWTSQLLVWTSWALHTLETGPSVVVQPC